LFYDLNMSEQRNDCVLLLTFFIVRLVFAAHSVISIWRVAQAYQNQYFWLLLISLLVLAIETVITLKEKNGEKWKW